MPVHGLLAPQVTGNARFKAALRRPRVRVAARRKLECTQPADDAPNGVPHFNQELVAAVAAHLSDVRVRCG